MLSVEWADCLTMRQPFLAMIALSAEVLRQRLTVFRLVANGFIAGITIIELLRMDTRSIVQKD